MDSGVGPSYTQRVIDLACLAAAAFGLALRKHKTQIALFKSEGLTDKELREVGIDSKARRAALSEISDDPSLRQWSIKLYAAKTWGQQTPREWLRRLYGLSLIAQGGTPLGESVALAAADLKGRMEERKVLFVFTDGMPDDAAVAQRAIKEAEQAGIEVCLIGIGDREDYVSYLHHRTAMCPSATALASVTMREVAEALHLGHTQH